MSTILALDLGKFKTVACWYEVGGGVELADMDQPPQIIAEGET